MDKFFWFEVILPIFLTALFYFTAKYLLFKLQKRGYRWGVLFSALALVIMAFGWVVVSRYSNGFQCETAYGDLASDPKMCNNPANGFKAIVQMPFLFGAWMVISFFAISKSGPLKIKN